MEVYLGKRVRGSSGFLLLHLWQKRSQSFRSYKEYLYSSSPGILVSSKHSQIQRRPCSVDLGLPSEGHKCSDSGARWHLIPLQTPYQFY